MFEIESFWLIMLLRSQGKGITQRNSGFGGLGQELYYFICNVLGGKLIANKVYADWTRYDIKMPINNYSLPETSAKYLIPINQLPKLLYWIIKHP
jgi:hypothetical protein